MTMRKVYFDLFLFFTSGLRRFLSLKNIQEILRRFSGGISVKHLTMQLSAYCLNNKLKLMGFIAVNQFILITPS